AGILDGEAIEAARAGGDGNAELEGKPGLAALGSAAEDADGRARPERGDEPAPFPGGVVKVCGAHEGQERPLVAHGAPVSSIAAWRVGSSRKVWPRWCAMRIAARRSLEAMRRTPRQARKSIAAAGSLRIFCLAPAALKAWSTAARKVSRSS